MMRRSPLFGLLLVFGALFIACDPGIGITFINNTDKELCFYESGFETPRASDLDPELCSEIEPNEKITYTTICQSDWLKWVILTVGESGPQIYARVATCGEWEDSGATITVDEPDGGFAVTDSLPDEPVSP